MTPFNRFSSSFYQNDRNVSGYLILVTDGVGMYVKVKVSEITQQCLKYLFHTDYDRDILDIENVRSVRGSPHSLVFLFQVQNRFHGKCENIEYLRQYATDVLNFSLCI